MPCRVMVFGDNVKIVEVAMAKSLKQIMKTLSRARREKIEQRSQQLIQEKMALQELCKVRGLASTFRPRHD